MSTDRNVHRSVTRLSCETSSTADDHVVPSKSATAVSALQSSNLACHNSLVVREPAADTPARGRTPKKERLDRRLRESRVICSRFLTSACELHFSGAMTAFHWRNNKE